MVNTETHAPHSHLKDLALTFAGLVVLTIVTVKVAQINFGSLAINISIALLIATLKATLVALYFMHLKWEEKLIIGFSVVSIPFIILMVTTIVWDIAEKTGEHAYPK